VEGANTMIREEKIAQDFIDQFILKMKEDNISLSELKTLEIYSDDANLYQLCRRGFYGLILMDTDNPIAASVTWSEKEDILPTADIIGYVMVSIKKILVENQIGR
jgi:hypothetical protein